MNTTRAAIGWCIDRCFTAIGRVLVTVRITRSALNEFTCTLFTTGRRVGITAVLAALHAVRQRGQ